MAGRVNISDAALFATTRNPKGSAGTARWMDRLAIRTVAIAVADAPVNNPLNAVHRGGVVGTYKASFEWDRRGGNKGFLRRTVWNTSDHANIVEKGRRSTKGTAFRWTRTEVFSWVGFRPPGSIHAVDGTGARDGYHVLREAQLSAWQEARYGYKVEAVFRPPKLRF